VTSAERRKFGRPLAFSTVFHADELRNARIDEGVGKVTGFTEKKFANATESNIGLLRENGSELNLGAKSDS